MTDEQITVPKKTLDLLKSQVASLMKAVGKSDMLEIPEEERGTSFLIPLYKESATAEPRRVIKYETVANLASFDNKGEEQVDQRVKVYLEPQKDSPNIKALETKLSRTTDEEKRAKTEAEIEAARDDIEKVMSLKDFGLKNIIKERVTIKGKKTMDGQTFIIFDWEGEEKELNIIYAN